MDYALLVHDATGYAVIDLAPGRWRLNRYDDEDSLSVHSTMTRTNGAPRRSTETRAEYLAGDTAGPLIEPDLLALDPAIVRWRLAATWPKDHPTEGELVPYVDARRVADRLDLNRPRLVTS